jgi:carboxyl-terminal processing protease
MKKIKFILIALVIVLSSNNGFAQRDDSLYYGLRVFSNVINHVRANYLEPVNSYKLIGGALYGMLRSLDPHTVYLNSSRFQEFMAIMDGKMAGLGLEMDIVDDKPIVVSIAPYSPAYSSKIRPGDILLSVNDSLTEGLSSQELELLLNGEEDEDVTLKLQSGITEKEYIEELEFETFDSPSIPFKFTLNESVGYIKCIEFRSTTPEELKDALDDFHSAHINDIIIDLRGNPGGYASASEEMAGLFLYKDKIISISDGRKKEMIDTVKNKEDEYLASHPKIILLIDRGSASASEMFSGALQDNDRAVLIGTNSFGKGLIMRTFLLDNGDAVLMTCGKYKTPAGRVVQREYKDKKSIDYRNEIYKTDSVNIKTRPTFKSVGGRALYCGGGIIPDIFIENDNKILHDLSVEEIQFYKYASKIIAEKSLLDNKKITPEDIKGMEIPQAYLDEILTTIKAKDDKQVPLLTKVISQKIKRNIAGILLGEETAYRLELDYDNQLQTALQTFPRVNSILFPNTKDSQE